MSNIVEQNKKQFEKKKKIVRYFDTDSNKNADVKKVESNKKPLSGDVINVTLKEKPLGVKFKNRNKKFKVEKDELADENDVKTKIFKKKFNRQKVEIPKKLIEKHSRGEKADEKGVKTKFFKEKLKRKEAALEYATEQAARTEILLHEQEGFLVADKEERTVDYRQEQIVKNVDITTATKHFKLNLQFGPYHHRYTQNGRHLLLGGKMGHLAAFDWITKKLSCEINVMEEIVDVSWMHVETMFACAQKKWVYFYDNKGTELHCVKKLFNVNKIEFLPYHFLLSAASSEGYVSWLDVSIGELAGHFYTNLGEIRIMRNNPSNGVMCIGGGKGVVSMWSPKVREPLAKVLCHPTPLCAMTIDPHGKHMVTSGLDNTVKVWDMRQLESPLATYKLRLPANQIEVSQRGVLALSMGNACQMYSQTVLESKCQPYLRQRCDDFIYGLRFCPFEDILGVSTGKGFQSLIVPGSGEPNFDSFELNPFQTKNQRREHEVHALLEKIPAEFITLEPNVIGGVDVTTLEEKVELKKSLFFLKPPKIDFTSRRKMKGKGGSVKAARNKQIVKDLLRKEFIQDLKQKKKNIISKHRVNNDSKNFIPLGNESTVLDRFKTKKKNYK